GTYPVYLGLGPAAYFDPALECPQPLPFRDTAPTAAQLAWLERHGVTHILSLTPIDLRQWPARQVWFGPDPCLNLPLGRPSSSGFYLYELLQTRGRLAWVEPSVGGTFHLRSYEPEQVVVETDSTGNATLCLTDLAYPGWQVEVDEQVVEAVTVENIFRGVALPSGRHVVRWTYRPTSLYWGLGMTGLGFLL
ncbi:MAG: YfhO family protein, partial [Planctomycetaceae bacterium]